MDYDFRSLFHMEAKKLVFLILLVFASAIAVQYFELPCSTALRSIFLGKSQVTGISTFSNRNGTYIGHNDTHVSNSSDITNVGVKNDSAVAKKGGSDVALGFDESRSDPEDEPFSKDSIQLVNNSTISPNGSPTGNNITLDSNSEEVSRKNGSINFLSPNPSLSLPPLSSIPNMKLLQANKQFITKNPKKAPLFYLPFSSRMLKETLYVPDSHNHKNMIRCLKDYLDLIGGRYSFWNRTGGADHFLVACHDWAPAGTRQIMANCIRALCNSDVKEGFKFGKDVSLPETYVRNAQNPLRELGGKRPSQRKILSFFAGSMHGYLRPILLQYWENKDPDMKIFGRMPKSKGNAN